MAVNQAQVDHIISSASADDPEVKLLKLQDEVELIKTSIKRLLIDIRERMNDMENPFNAGMQGQGDSSAGPVSKKKSSKVVEEPEEEDEEEEETAAVPHVPSSKVVIQPTGSSDPGSVSRFSFGGMSDDAMISAMRAQLSNAQGSPDQNPREIESADKVRLKKVFRLFEWTKRTVRKYGHDRVDLMLESYRAMGYISDESAKLVRDITRLMPTTLGELHDISADEFVSELYELNHILDPTDATLDRDMIEVLMEKRGAAVKQNINVREEHAPQEEQESDFIRSKDRI